MSGSEAEARALKAAKLAAAIVRVHPDAALASIVRRLPQEGRRLAEQLAAVRKASDETWELVAQLLEMPAERTG